MTNYFPLITKYTDIYLGNKCCTSDIFLQCSRMSKNLASKLSPRNVLRTFVSYDDRRLNGFISNCLFSDELSDLCLHLCRPTTVVLTYNYISLVNKANFSVNIKQVYEWVARDILVCLVKRI